MKKAGRVCAKVELEVGARGCCPGQMGESHWGACALCTLWERGTASQPPETRLSRQSGPGADPQEEARERVLQQHSSLSAGQAPGQGTTERASGTRSLSPCLEQLQHAIATRGVSPLSQLRRCLRRAARCQCCVQDSSSFDGGGSRSMAPAQLHHVPLPSHALSLLAKTAVACNVVGAQVVPAHRATGVRLRLVGPFLHCLATSSCPRHCPGPHPNLQPST